MATIISLNLNIIDFIYNNFNEEFIKFYTYIYDLIHVKYGIEILILVILGVISVQLSKKEAEEFEIIYKIKNSGGIINKLKNEK